MAPSTPPPPSSDGLAAFTIAWTCSVAMSPSTTSRWGPTRRSVGSRTEALQGPSARTPGCARAWAAPTAAPDAKKKPLALGFTTEHSNTTVIPEASFPGVRRVCLAREHADARTRHHEPDHLQPGRPGGHPSV